MRPTLKNLDEQVMVITGATSGIGLVTARQAAQAGARVVQEINAGGGEAAYAVADVGDEAAVPHIAEVAVDRFGGIDT